MLARVATLAAGKYCTTRHTSSLSVTRLQQFSKGEKQRLRQHLRQGVIISLKKSFLSCETNTCLGVFEAGTSIIIFGKGEKVKQGFASKGKQIKSFNEQIDQQHESHETRF